MGVSIRSGNDQLLVEVAANERHERSASRMYATHRQPRGNLGDLGVVAGHNLQRQLAGGLDG
jgi:hypothetical protein